jgi:hypothetical protein
VWCWRGLGFAFRLRGSQHMKFKAQILILILVGWGALSACQNESARHQDPLDKAYQKIDRGEYSSAIDDLNALSQTDPRPEVLVTLASAYAGRAGIKVAQYWGFVIGFKAPLLNADDIAVGPTVQSLKKIEKQAGSKLSQAELQALGEFVRAMELWDLYKDRIEAIPTVSGEPEQDLLSAVDVLSRVQTPGGRLYRAILNLILLKSMVVASPEATNEFSTVIEKTLSGDTEAFCKFDFVQLGNWLTPVSQQLGETLSDLVIAFPEQSPSLNAAQAQLLDIDGKIVKARKQLKQKRGCQ